MPGRSWKELLVQQDETVTLPWMGGRTLHASNRHWRMRELPSSHGWFTFRIEGRWAQHPIQIEPQPDLLRHHVRGYLVGDRLVEDGKAINPDPRRIQEVSERVHLIELGLDRFARITAGRIYPEGPLVFSSLEMPLGPEEEVQQAFLNRGSISGLKHITPALEAAFMMECYHREMTEKRRAELEVQRREAEAQRALEARRQEILQQLGDGQGRRELALVDFETAARAALQVGGAELLDHRRHHQAHEWVVRYRLEGRQYECVCDDSLHIVDAGVCLTWSSGFKGDELFTLESLPSVILEGDREGRLVVYRH